MHAPTREKERQFSHQNAKICDSKTLNEEIEMNHSSVFSECVIYIASDRGTSWDIGGKNATLSGDYEDSRKLRKLTQSSGRYHSDSLVQRSVGLPATDRKFNSAKSSAVCSPPSH